MCEILSKIFWLAAFFLVGYFVPVQGDQQQLTTQIPGFIAQSFTSKDFTENSAAATTNSIIVWRYIVGKPINNGNTDVKNKGPDANLGSKQYLIYGNKLGFHKMSELGYSQDISGGFRSLPITGQTIRL